MVRFFGKVFHWAKKAQIALNYFLLSFWKNRKKGTKPIIECGHVGPNMRRRSQYFPEFMEEPSGCQVVEVLLKLD